MTPKQEKFCQLYIELGNASEAYRQAYDAVRMSAASVNRKAKELLDNGKITARLRELGQAHLEAHGETVESIAKMLKEDRAFAIECGKPSAAVSASMGLAKLYGLLTDKTELTGKDGGPVQLTAIERRIVDPDN
ncbi:terminase small subunit [Synechococcus phage Yong-M3-232]|nr:terminase small subunit [Synechococcus phage Yong-M3-232]